MRPIFFGPSKDSGYEFIVRVSSFVNYSFLKEFIYLSSNDEIIALRKCNMRYSWLRWYAIKFNEIA